MRQLTCPFLMEAYLSGGGDPDVRPRRAVGCSGSSCVAYEARWRRCSRLPYGVCNIDANGFLTEPAPEPAE